jgi:hypothetical protein
MTALLERMHAIRLGGRARMACAIVFLVALAGCAPARHYEAARVLQDLAAGTADSRLKQTTPAPLRQAVSYSVEGRARRGDLYLPGPLAGCGVRPARCPRAAIVAVPGAVPLGKDDPRLVAFVTTLARAGFAVLVPELAGFRQLRIRPADAREVADAFAWISRRPVLAPAGRAGMAAFSYSVGPAILAALEDDIRERVRFIVGVGGYYDLPNAMRFFTTGWFEHDGRWQRVTPDDTGRMVLRTAGCSTAWWRGACATRAPTSRRSPRSSAPARARCTRSRSIPTRHASPNCMRGCPRPCAPTSAGSISRGTI